MKAKILLLVLIISSNAYSQKFTNYTENALGLNIEMVAVEGGSFYMGTSSEYNDDLRHKVTLSNFYIGKFEITQEQWVKIMTSNPAPDNDCLNCPVLNISWQQVQEFLKKLNAATKKNYFLPTEAQWEFSAKGGNLSKGYDYSGSNNSDEVSWNLENSGERPHPVGKKYPNELGIFDMSGNVKEWCNDWYGSYSDKEEKDPKGPQAGEYHVMRGGGFGRYATKITLRDGTSEASNFLGFRIALSQ